MSGASDPAAFLASRAQVSEQECARVWGRATAAAATDAAPVGDELVVLKELSRLMARTTRRD